MRHLLVLALPLSLSGCFFIVKDGNHDHVHDHAAPAAAAATLAAPTEASAQKSTAAKVFPYAIHEKTLPNGLKAIVVPMPSDGLVSYWSVVRTGSRDEVEPGVTGFAHFFEHMMFRGTERHPEYDKITNGIGADAN